MNSPTLRALQKSLAEARRRRKRMWVGETHVWSYLERLTEPAGYQGLLFAGAAGAQPKIVKWALEHGANATEPLGYEWPAVEGGQFRQIPAFGPAFVWRTNAKETRSGALVYVPMDAAICGACSDSSNAAPACRSSTTPRSSTPGSRNTIRASSRPTTNPMEHHLARTARLPNGTVPVFLVCLRQPGSTTDHREDPYWEVGSLGCTVCHSTNLLHPGTNHTCVS